MKRFAVVAVAIVAMLGAVAYAKDKVHGDFFYDGLGADALPVSVMFNQTRAAVLAGDYQGLGKVSVVPAAPSAGVKHFYLTGVGEAEEDKDGIVTTVPCGEFVTTYPADGGYATIAVDGGTAVRCLVQSGITTDTDGGSIVTFPVQFNSTPVCTAGNQSAAKMPTITPAYTTVTFAGTVNTNDVIAYSCRGYR